MRAFLSLMGLLVVAALAAPLYLTGPDGQPIMTLGDYVPELPELPEQVHEAMPDAAIYRWQDDLGVWQFGADPPGGVAAERVSVGSEAITRLPAGWAPPPNPDRSATAAPLGASLPGVHGNVPGFVDAARAAAAAMEQQARAVEDLAGR